MRNPRRTASTAAALMIGLGLVSFVAVFAASLRASANEVLDQTLKADFVITTSGFTPFSPQLAQDLQGDPALAAVSPFRQGGARVDGKTIVIGGIDPTTITQVAAIGTQEGNIADLGPGQIAVYKGVAETNGWKVGDTITVAFARTGEQPFEVAGIFSDNRLLNSYVVTLDSYDANFTTPDVMCS
jgi:putative ABC transport system permease protein